MRGESAGIVDATAAGQSTPDETGPASGVGVPVSACRRPASWPSPDPDPEPESGPKSKGTLLLLVLWWQDPQAKATPAPPTTVARTQAHASRIAFLPPSCEK